MRKLFILDTNVRLHDPQAIFKFEDNELIIPIYVMEEIDRFKRDSSERGRNARAGGRIAGRGGGRGVWGLAASPRTGAQGAAGCRAQPELGRQRHPPGGGG